ncbi:formyltetrahydrofolate deformylase [Hydrogenophaga palleronii]|uniref:Formyltetrahydrofolate deformylase n=1 Tax=Hydrogenophaga palleronii TaxID=65655 RepID=A0ABU1WMV0_9BURK|nr:formyltetrahydrofolate deformylase [Hydrogenophaga palleronii]MDR7150613.1 formyltetrahydrofolate deformylase [Hydrogenophaga palleronii]
MKSEPNSHYCLNLACGSAQGQVAAVSALLDRHGAYIEQFSVFDDHTTQRFFVRGVFSLQSPVEELRKAFGELAQRFPQAQWQVHDLEHRTRVLIMVSKFDHCLRELIAQWRRGELNMDIVAIASNHPDLAPLAEAEGLPFHHLSISAETKPQQEQKLRQLIADTGAEFVVLARYMQVLSEELCEELHGRVINIHHSFLPGFKGGRPYQQAHDRGVKLIGATAHFATPDLDEGPIIEQSLERVDHADTPQDLAQAGRLVESLVLSRALRFILQRRVFINGMKTVVLR